MWSEFPAGYVFSAHALKGEISVGFLFEPEVDLKKHWKKLVLEKNSQRFESDIISFRSHQTKGKKGYLVLTQDCNDRDQAEALKGAKVYMGPEFYLKGHLLFLWKKQLKDQNSKSMGQISYFSSHAGCTWLEVQPEDQTKKTFLVPYDKKQVLDEGDDFLQMDLPEGLEDL